MEFLEAEIRHNRRRINDGSKRIKAYYDPSFEKPERYQEYEDEPPHRILIERGIEIIAFSALDLFEEKVVVGSPEFSIEKILYGVGTESLFNGFHLVIDPDGFVDEIQEPRWETPSLTDSIKKIENDLKEKLIDDDYKMAELYFELISNHRNNEVHLGYHSDRMTYLRRLVLEFTLKLGVHYYGNGIPREDEISSKIKDLRSKELGTSLQIRFDEGGTLDSS